MVGVSVPRDANSPARTCVLHPVLARSPAAGHACERVREPESRLAEAVSLARAIDLDVIEADAVPVQRPRPATLFGPGRVEAVADAVSAHELGLVVVDGALTPVQQRNLERAWHCKVIDRTALILEIFAARARTREGRLQVELAALRYQRSRLVRSWTHLERQRGGFGFVGGPGETQIEADRRQIRVRIGRLERALDGVKRTRGLHRAARQRVPYPVVALVGYTNAGKTTLFNRLTGASATARDQLFATLDPTMRAVALPSGQRVILSDTVVLRPPTCRTTWWAAFRATLEEVVAADLVVHVRDCAHADSAEQRADVLRVLTELGLEDRLGTGVVEVLNKLGPAGCAPARLPRGVGGGKGSTAANGPHRSPGRRRRLGAHGRRDRRSDRGHRRPADGGATHRRRAGALCRRRDSGLALPPRRGPGACRRRGRGPPQGGPHPGGCRPAGAAPRRLARRCPLTAFPGRTRPISPQFYKSV